MICLLLTLLLAAQSVSQDSSSTGCKGSIINQYFGSDQHLIQHSVVPSGREAPGPPGKRGPIGHMGTIGPKGDPGVKGQKGEPVLASTILELKRAINRLENSVNAIVPATCKHVALSPGSYPILPLGLDGTPFYAYCEESPTGVRKTLIGHDSETEIAADNCEAPRCYRRKVTYDVSMEDIVRLIDASQQCRQFIQFRCRGSLLHQRKDVYGAWLSRNGTLKLNWGGTKKDYYCACGETGTCIDNTHKCNCDQNGPIDTSDEGYLTNKEDLPVTEMHFGDMADSSEFGWHTLGKLECW